MLEANVVGVLRLTAGIARPMLRQRRGSIVNISSRGSATASVTDGVWGSAGGYWREQPAPDASDGADRPELLPGQGAQAPQVAVNVLFPAGTRSRGSDGMVAGRRAQGQGVGALLRPERVVPLVVYLAQQDAAGETGRAFDAVAWNMPRPRRPLHMACIVLTALGASCALRRPHRPAAVSLATLRSVTSGCCSTCPLLRRRRSHNLIVHSFTRALIGAFRNAVSHPPRRSSYSSPSIATNRSASSGRHQSRSQAMIEGHQRAVRALGEHLAEVDQSGRGLEGWVLDQVRSSSNRAIALGDEEADHAADRDLSFERVGPAGLVEQEAYAALGTDAVGARRIDDLLEASASVRKVERRAPASRPRACSSTASAAACAAARAHTGPPPGQHDLLPIVRKYALPGHVRASRQQEAGGQAEHRCRRARRAAKGDGPPARPSRRSTQASIAGTASRDRHRQGREGPAPRSRPASPSHAAPVHPRSPTTLERRHTCTSHSRIGCSTQYTWALRGITKRVVQSDECISDDAERPSDVSRPNRRSAADLEARVASKSKLAAFCWNAACWSLDADSMTYTNRPPAATRTRSQTGTPPPDSSDQARELAKARAGKSADSGAPPAPPSPAAVTGLRFGPAQKGLGSSNVPPLTSDS